MSEFNTGQLRQWLSGYKHSWERQDADAFVGLFTADALYIDRPFSEPVAAPDFHRFWTDLAKRQAEMHIEFDILGLEGHRAFVNFQATYVCVPGGEHRTGDGLLVLDFDDAGRCGKLREWQHWHSDGTKPEQVAHGDS